MDRRYPRKQRYCGDWRYRENRRCREDRRHFERPPKALPRLLNTIAMVIDMGRIAKASKSPYNRVIAGKVS
jgi:hypothetical protein